MTTTDLDIHGMTCASCVAHVEGRLNNIDGVEATVNLATESAHVTHDDHVADADLIAAVEAAGYEARVRGDEHAHDHDDPGAHLGRRLALAAPLTAIVVLLAMVPGVPRLPWLQLVLTLPVLGWAGWPFHRAAWRAARHRSSTMDTLVSIGTVAAFGWSTVALVTDSSDHSYFEVATVVTTFLLLGRRLEARSKRDAGAALRALLEAGAKRAVLADLLGEREVDVAELRPGNRVVVRPGAQVPTDAVVVDGTSHLDESMVTGESRPVVRRPGDRLIGGTLNLDTRLVAEVTSVGADTVLARIAAAVARAQEGKAPVQRIADRVSAVFVPVVLSIALITLVAWRLGSGSWSDAFVAAVAVLVVACPCALGLATPTALLVGTGRAAQLGIVVRDAAVLERVRSIDTVVLDKTGTLTTGMMTVRSTTGDDSAISLAAAVEAGSEHPIARAIAAHAPSAMTATSVTDVAGSGVRGIVDGHRVEVGRPAELTDQALAGAYAAARARGETAVVVRVDGVDSAVIGVGDSVKPDAADAVATMRGLGLSTVLLTGDHRSVAEEVAREVGVDEVISDVLPEHKGELVERLRAEGRSVAMVGDGTNDAIALTGADLGIAMGTGTGVAIETADIVLMNSDPGAIPQALRLSVRTLRTIRQNLVWAFGYNVVAIPLAAAGLLNPMIAGAAMAASSVCVVLNSLRLRRFGRD